MVLTNRHRKIISGMAHSAREDLIWKKLFANCLLVSVDSVLDSTDFVLVGKLLGSRNGSRERKSSGRMIAM